LEDIFSTDENAFIGLTVHFYAISAILRAVGFPYFERVRVAVSRYLSEEKDQTES
jgi:hypothetical protein